MRFIRSRSLAFIELNVHRLRPDDRTRYPTGKLRHASITLNTKPYKPPDVTEERAAAIPGYSAVPRSTWLVLSVLLLCSVVLAFGDIGFDRPGRFGLDFFHAMLLLATSAVAAIIGLGIACWHRSGASAAITVSGMLVVVLAVVIGG